MFNKNVEKRIEKLENKLELNCEEIKNEFNQKMVVINDKISNIQSDYNTLKEKILNDNLAFRQEMDEKYLRAVEKLFSLNKDLSLMGIMAINKEGVKGNMTSDLMKPLLEAKWEQDKEAKGKKIVSMGVKIIEKQKELHDEILDGEKKGRDVENLREQIKSFNWILDEIK